MPTKPIVLPVEIDLDAFISTQAHDLRTPFNHIIGFSKMTLNTVGDSPLNDCQKEDLGTIYRSGLRALTYMNGLIDIARLNRGEKDIHPSNAILLQCVDHAVSQWKKFYPGDHYVESRLNTTTSTINTDEQIFRQLLTGFIAFVAFYCEGRMRLDVAVGEEPKRFIFTFASTGNRGRQLPQLDLEISGFVNRALVELLGGEILKAEENDQGALVQFSLPKA